MQVGRKQWYEGVLSIPEGKAEDWVVQHIVHPPNQPLARRNFRTSFLGGHSVPPIVLDHESRWHRLTEGGNTWMTDLPIEQWQCDEVIKSFRGHVLVGGLGLGYAAVALSAKRNVKRIHIVEKSKAVIDLVWSHIRTEKMDILHTDLFEYLVETQEPYDWGFYDIWQSDSEHTFHSMVAPLRQLSRRKVKHVLCWNEDVMRGQLFGALRSRLAWLPLKGNEVVEALKAIQPDSNFHAPSLDELTAPPTGDIWHDWAVPFWEWVREYHPTSENALKAAMLYARFYDGQEPSHLRQIMRVFASSLVGDR